MIKKRKFSVPGVIFITLCVLFLLFSFSIYLKPLQVNAYRGINAEMASEGRLVWQKYNCQSCHQLYGLGGYLGPDLTNVYGKYQNNDDVLRFFFKAGIKQMPVFNLSPKEENQLIEFLKNTNASGGADPRNYEKKLDGMIEQYERR